MHTSPLSDTSNTVSTVRTALISLLLLAGAWTLSVYLQLEPVPLMRLLLIAASFFALKTIRQHPPKKREYAVFALFSCAVSLTLILGYHIHMEDRYQGTALQNYITPYALTDVLAFFVMIPALTALFCALFRALRPSPAGKVNLTAEGAPARRRRLLVFSALMACYLPYLLAYYPGIVLNDTLTSISQALERQPLVNHHPVMYTLFIKLCMNIGEALLHSRTAGYALYTLCQMLYVSACLAYLIDWVSRRVRRSTAAAVAMTALFGLVPYFAAYSVAGWKDPIFSVSVAALSVMLLDDALRPEESRSLRSIAAYFGMLLMVAFSRTNGVGVIACAAIWQLVCLIARKAAKRALRPGMFAATAASLAVFFLVHGPVFSAMGVTTDKREVNSLVLQQMARVAALDGDMTEDDRAFLDALLPLEQYKETYRPCCVDLLKWDENFSTAAMAEDMYGHWFSLLLRNPVAYIEAWQLNTFGFWTLNVPQINYADWNLSAGVIRNKLDAQYVANTYAEYGIEMKNLFGGDALRRFLPTDEWFIPAGWMFWGCAFLALCLLLRGRLDLMITLVPTFGLLLPLILVTPTCYWIRYAAAAHYLIPVYLFLFSLLKNEKEPANHS